MDTGGLSAICAGLGRVEEDRTGNRIGYTKGEYCSDNLKDLLRFLRRDDPHNRDVFKQLCKWNTVSKDIIPIIEHCQEDRSLVLNSVKVLVFLTMPIDPSSSDISQQLEYLWGLKSSVTCCDIVAVVVSLMEGPLENLERDGLTEDDWKLVQLILTLFRNLLAIQEISAQQKAWGASSHFLSLRDRFLELLFRENVMDLIIVIVQHFGGYLRKDNLLLLEIFHYVFLGQEPELVAKARLKGTKASEGSKASISSLKSIMEEEDEKRRHRVHKMVRHSHFIGTFTRHAMDGSKEVFNGKPTLSRGTLVKQQKVSRGPTKPIAWNHVQLPPSRDEILELLHDFVNQFLSGGYNGLIQSLHEDIEKEHPSIQKSDVIVFFHVVQFVTSFQYFKFLNLKLKMGAGASQPLDDMHSDDTLFEGDICGPIAASMNESMFQLVFSNWRETFEGLKETQNFKFLSAAGSLMKNMICVLDLVLNELSEDSRESQTARILLYKLFYDQTDQGLTQFLLNLIKSFDTHKQAKSDLEDLIEMISKILQLMENLQASGTLRVSKKNRRRRKKKVPIEKEEKSDFFEENSSIQNETDSSNTNQPAEMDTAPKDSSNTDKPAEPNTESKSRENTSSDGNRETMATGHSDQLEEPVLETDHENMVENTHKSPGNVKASDDLHGTDDSSGDEQVAATSEVDFNVSTLVSSFANHNIIQNICWLLKFYKNNSSSTNEYIIRMLQRISNDLELSPMLYQLSLLTSFYDILAQQKSCPCKEYANIVDFLTSLVREMLKKMKSQPLLFVEVLFWKSRKECHYIEADYLVRELGHFRKESKNWGVDSANLDTGTSQSKGWTGVSIADALGEDEADVEIIHDLRNDIEVNLHGVEGRTSPGSEGEFDGQETHRKVKNSTVREPGKVAKMKKRIALGSDLDEKIKDLYEKFKDSQDCNRLIAEDLDPDGRVSTLQVTKKLKQLGLKSASRKKLRHVANTSAFHSNSLDGEERPVETGSPRNSHDREQGSLSRATNARKRGTFSEDQEATIRALYEQFKDHKRCSYMIANAMEEDGKFTAAQVSRKLKQLGIHVPQKKRSQTSKHLKDGDPNEFSAEKESDSDNETLSSLVNRGKKRVSNDMLVAEDVHEKLSAEKFSQDSDDEILASVVKKRKGRLSDLNVVRLTETSSEDVADDGLENGAVEGRKDRETRGQSSSVPTGLDQVDDVTVSMDNIREETEESPGNSKKPMDVDGSVSLKSLYSAMDDDDTDKDTGDLEDSEDEMGYSEPASSSVVNRRRMVLDFEDDD